MTKNNNFHFPEHFIWGVGNSAYQSEGAYREDGKGESIWDRFCQIPGNIIDAESGNVASDFYHRYEDDIKLMQELSVKHFRMSIAWSRVLPEGTGPVNQAGIDFYHRVIDCLIEHGIEPCVTLYWWDLPQKIQDRGGWANRKTCDYFEEYVQLVFKEYGSKVKLFITLDEPYCCAFIGHHLGTMAPGHRDFHEALAASYHLLLAHARAVRLFRDLKMEGKIGIALNLSDCNPGGSHKMDVYATQLADGLRNRWFLDPLLKGRFPQDLIDAFKENNIIVPEMLDEDLALMKGSVDFVGLNYYSPHFYVYDESGWPLPHRAVQVGKPINDIGWEIVPEALYNIMRRIVDDYGDIPLLVTANGNCVTDLIDRDGKIVDHARIDYMYRHIEQVARALRDGIDVIGYYAFSIFDNLEWALGFTKRFGLVYVDFKTQKRLPKESAYWFRDVMERNGLQ